MSTSNKISIPLSVSTDYKKIYEENYRLATHDSGRLMLFAGDQKVEHLNDDFYGKGIATEDADPIHLFNIAGKSKIGMFASQLGLISQYGMDYPSLPYLIKLNSKTHLVKTSQTDPLSKNWYSIETVMDFKKKSGLNIMGVGYTIYLGSEYESDMLQAAANIINNAHNYGLLTVIWAYPRGKAVPDEKDPHIIAGAAGAVACLGADFVKVNYPKKEGISSPEALKEAVKAAGRTKLICAGGSNTDVEKFIHTLHDQIHISGASGNATGRNVHQKNLNEAVAFCNAIYAVTVENKTAEQALQIYHRK